MVADAGHARSKSSRLTVRANALLQPANIYEFGARYFAGLQGQSEPEGLGRAVPQEANASHRGTDVEEAATNIDIASLTPAELEPLLMSELGARAGPSSALQRPA